MSQGILVLNPGTTSTKVAVFDGGEEVWRSDLQHDAADLAPFNRIADQLEYRYGVIAQELPEEWVERLEVVVGRGGLLRPVEGGVYTVNRALIDDVSAARWGEHASNLGPMLARRFATEHNLQAFIVDPVTTDEFPEISRISGVPGIERKCRSHALNIKSVAHRTAKKLGVELKNTRFVVAHLGGGISIAALDGGRIVDVNDGLLGMGPFSPERAGALPLQGVMDLMRDKGFDETRRIFSRQSGLMGYLGTSDLREVESRVEAGDEAAELIYSAMIYQITKEIGAMSAALGGSLDAIIMTGGLTNSETLVQRISEKVEFIAPIELLPGEEEMLALAEGALRVLTGEEQAKVYGESE